MGQGWDRLKSHPSFSCTFSRAPRSKGQSVPGGAGPGAQLSSPGQQLGRQTEPGALKLSAGQERPWPGHSTARCEC